MSSPVLRVMTQKLTVHTEKSHLEEKALINPGNDVKNITIQQDKQKNEILDDSFKDSRDMDKPSLNEEDFENDDEYDVRRLRLRRFYQDSDPRMFITHESDSIIACEGIIRKIVDNAANQTIENYYMSIMPKHALGLMNELIERTFEIYLLQGETNIRHEIYNRMDQEPPVVKMDNWVRNMIVSEKKSPTHVPAHNNKTPAPAKENSVASDDSKLIYTRAREVAKNFLENVKDDQLPAPINLLEQRDVDENEDRLREFKEKDQRKKEEQKEQNKMRLNELRQQQAELHKQLKENKTKNFTFDYEGKLIMVHPFKGDKLPAATVVMNTHISDYVPEGEKDDKGKKKKGPREKVVSKANKFKQTPGDEKEFVKALVPTPPIWDFFYPNPGVSLVLEGRTKTEPRSSNLNMSNLNDPKVRLTRNEYNNLTRSGNLSRENLSKAYFPPSDGAFLNQVNENEEFDSHMKASEGSSPILKTKAKKKIKNKDTVIGGISKNYELLTNAISETEEAMIQQQRQAQQEIERQQKLADKRKKEDFLKRSPVDEFNMGIINSRDWGKSSMGTGFTPNKDLNPLKPSEKQFRSSVGLEKKPRERVIGQENIKSKGLRYLPPPMIGKTVGHGISPASNILESMGSTEY